MSNKTTIYLSDDDIKYLDEFKKNKKHSSRNKALSAILAEHKNGSDITIKSMYQFMADKIADELKNELKDFKNDISNEVISNLKPQLNSLKYSSNTLNKDSQIVLEMLNGIYYKEDYGNIPAIDKIPSQAYSISKERVETKIAKEHYRKSGSLD